MRAVALLAAVLAAAGLAAAAHATAQPPTAADGLPSSQTREFGVSLTSPQPSALPSVWTLKAGMSIDLRDSRA